MNHLDLFSGIGGFSLAAQWVWGEDHNIVAFCEIDPFCQKVLRKHWPDVPIHDDIRTYKHNGTNVDLVTGGFPCQDISIAGLGDGLDGERSGLWKEMFDIISRIRPQYCIIENSAALLVRGGVVVISNFASIGYSAQWQIISAREIGAPHERKRLFIIAYPDSFYGEKGLGNIFKRASEIFEESKNQRNVLWLQTPDKNHRMDDGISTKSYRLAIEAYGNSIVPQVVVPIMEAIKQLEV